MRKCLNVLFAACVIGASVSSVMAKNKPAPKQSPLKGEYAMLAREAGLSDEQVVKVAQLVAKNKQELSQWKAQNGKQIAAAKKALEQARKAKDKEASAKAKAELKKLESGKATLSKQLKEDIQSILTDEQKVKWEGFTLYRSLTRKLAKAKLTKEQKAQIRKLADEAGEELSKVNDNAARKKIISRVEKAARAFIKK